MNTNKIIFGLTVVVVILIIIGIIIARRPPAVTPTPTPTPTASVIAPTGIITPTEMFKPNELDIVSISPQDKAVNISIGAAIEIVFSRAVKTGEIKLYMDPPAERIEKIEGNRLSAVPNGQWTEGTTYRFSIYFVNAKEKNRTYTFTTAGPTNPNQSSGDTRDEEAIEEESNIEREQHPDIYVANHSPYESSSFYVSAEYVSTGPAHMGVRVILKGNDKDQSKIDFVAWLKSIGLRDDQISSLDIQYR